MKTLNKTGAINDPLGQTHSPATRKWFCLRYSEIWGQTCVKIVINRPAVTMGRLSRSLCI